MAVANVPEAWLKKLEPMLLVMGVYILFWSWTKTASVTLYWHQVFAQSYVLSLLFYQQENWIMPPECVRNL